MPIPFVFFPLIHPPISSCFSSLDLAKNVDSSRIYGGVRPRHRLIQDAVMGEANDRVEADDDWFWV